MSTCQCSAKVYFLIIRHRKPVKYIFLVVIAAKSSDIVKKQGSATKTDVGLTPMERDDADYAVVRPTDAADDSDVNGDYAYPTMQPSVPGGSSSREYLELLPEHEKPLRLLAVFTRQDNDVNISDSGGDKDITKKTTTVTEDKRIDPSDARDSATDEQQPATYIEVI